MNFCKLFTELTPFCVCYLLPLILQNQQLLLDIIIQFSTLLNRQRIQIQLHLILLTYIPLRNDLNHPD